MKKISLLIITLLVGFCALGQVGQKTYSTTTPTSTNSLPSVNYRYSAITPDSLNQLWIYNPLTSRYNRFYSATEANKLFAPLVGGGYVPTSRTLTINGVTQDLSANRTWTINTTPTQASLTGNNRIALWNSNDSLTVLPQSYFNYNLSGNYFQSFAEWNLLGTTNMGNTHFLLAPSSGDNPLRKADSTIYQRKLTLTTNNTSGPAQLTGNTLNIPQYSGGGGGVTSVLGTTNRITVSPTTGNAVVDISSTFEGLLEKVANKATTYGTVNNTLYPSLQLMRDSTLHPNKNLSDVPNKSAALKNLGAQPKMFVLASDYNVPSFPTDGTTQIQAAINAALSGYTVINQKPKIWFAKGYYTASFLINADKVDFVGEDAYLINGVSKTINRLIDFSELQLLPDRSLTYAGNTAIRHPFLFIGDSITEGTAVPDFATQSYASIVRTQYQKYYTNRDYGFQGFNFAINQSTTNTYMKFVRSGFSIGSYFDGDYYGGINATSVASGDYIEFTYTGKDFNVLYGSDPSTGSTIQVKVDGTIKDTIDIKSIGDTTNNAGRLAKGSFSPAQVIASWGFHTVRLTNIENKAASLIGVQFVENAAVRKPLLNNVGRSSLKMTDLPDNLIDFYCGNGSIVLSLGVNDQLFSTDTAVFKTKYLRFLNNIKTNRGQIIVQDFIFNQPQSDKYKTILREMALQYGVTYLDYAKLWIGDATNNALFGLLDVDGVHPTPLGHQFIANTLLKYLNINSINSLSKNGDGSALTGLTYSQFPYTPLNPSTYPVNSGGETLTSVLTRNQSTTVVPSFGGTVNSYGADYNIQVGTESGTHGIMLRAGTSGIGKLSFDNGTNGDGAGRLWYDFSTNKMKFYTSSNGTASNLALTLNPDLSAVFEGTATANRSSVNTTDYINNPALKGSFKGALGTNDIAIGTLGVVENTSSTAGTGDAHAIGTFGQAFLKDPNDIYGIGVEGRADVTTANSVNSYGLGVLGYAKAVNSHFDDTGYSRLNLGMAVKSEIFMDDGVTPNPQGLNIGAVFNKPVGGAVQWSMQVKGIAKFEDEIKATLPAFSSGTPKLTVYNGVTDRFETTVSLPSGTTVSTPTNANDAVNKSYADGLIKTGQISLTAGVATITVSGLTTSSIATTGFVAIGGTVSTTWQYKAVCTANTLTITAITNAGTTDTSDTSTLNYIVKP